MNPARTMICPARTFQRKIVTLSIHARVSPHIIPGSMLRIAPE
jgi:hypothetical protein